MEKEKFSFFKKIKTSVFDFDGYQNLAAEKVGKTLAYIAILMLIFSIIVSAIYTFQIYNLVNNTRKYIDSEIEEVSYENNILSIIPKSGEDIIRINVNGSTSNKIIINTQTEDNEEIQTTINEINNSESGILILSDRILIKSGLSDYLTEIEYNSISEMYNIDSMDKAELLNLLSGQDIYIALLLFALKIIIYLFIVYFSTILIDIILLLVLTYIVTRIAGLRLKYTAIYNIAAYSLTLPIILNIMYFIINSFTGFTIKYFQVMYTAIASIYVITAILMIKSDVIKKQFELNRIIEEQERVREELKRKEEEEKEKEEERRNREKEKEEEKKKEKDGINKEPEGDNA